ncbi:hypothetical protein HSR122_0143 [Halapricum desulfuricans]|uniref:Uncharacterized protein n=1 Tax=Halapricum desulfuricans TaxID=2841257 RepID=A0A897MZP8_9EURY|nr:hypothetical protein HSR122_0143 [Halapricum desulfuricans]
MEVARACLVLLLKRGAVSGAVGVRVVSRPKTTDRTFADRLLGTLLLGSPEEKRNERDEQEEHSRLEVPPDDSTDHETPDDPYHGGRGSRPHHTEAMPRTKKS